jgi:hypothetical protein
MMHIIYGIVSEPETKQNFRQLGRLAKERLDGVESDEKNKGSL